MCSDPLGSFAMGLAGMGRLGRQPQPALLRAAGSVLPSRLPPPRQCGTGSGSTSRRRRVMARPCAQALPGKLLGMAAKAAAAPAAAGSSLAASMAAAIDPGVLAATISASGKLLLICAAVGWLLRTGRIPNSTATVMSQVGGRGPELAGWSAKVFACDVFLSRAPPFPPERTAHLLPTRLAGVLPAAHPLHAV